jgi:inorganic pyrophosphatase
MSYKDIPFGSSKQFNVVVEIPQKSRVKYEYDEEWDEIKLEWIFTGGFCFPFDYGYVPQTRGGDGDHLDAFVLGSESAALGTVVPCRAIGMIELIDRGERDNKILAIPIADPLCQNYEGLKDLPFNYETVFTEFFRELGVQKKKTMKIVGFREASIAIQELEQGHKDFS